MSSPKKAWHMQTLQGRRWMRDQRVGQLIDIVEKNDHDQLEEALTENPIQHTRHLTMALERAILFKSDKNVRCVRLLLRHGADANGCDGIGTPYIILAAEAKCWRVTRALIDAGCDVNAAKQDGSSALHKAVMYGELSMVRVLLEAGADICLVDNASRTSLLLACSLNHTDIARVILGDIKNCDTVKNIISNMADSSNNTPVYHSICHNNHELLKLLLYNGAVADDNTNPIPIILAAFHGSTDCIGALYNHGVKVNSRNSHGETALIVSAKQRNIDSFRYLLKVCNADPSLMDNHSNAAILFVTDIPELVALMLSKNSPVNFEGSNGHTPLSIAVENAHTLSVLLFLKYGADADPIFKLNEHQLKPLQTALWNNYKFETQLLFSYCVEMGYDMTWLEDFLSAQEMAQGMRNESAQWVTNVMYNVEHKFPKLITLCRWLIRDIIGDSSLCNKINSLPLPKGLKDFLNFKQLEEFIVPNDE